ncbi:Ger(x)C family spore germination protein [Bacillaceae bacterium Marseille-Q3522]|nr:Ger(x)C family spore germination protein [Bacillaceae bacterium Marseille-Q3522]
MKNVLFSLITLSLLLTGCWDIHEAERMVYVHGMGVDYKDGKYTVYFQFINLSLLAKAESTKGSQDITSEIGHATGDSIQEAVFQMYKSTQRRIFWGHLTYIIFSEDTLKVGGMQPVLDFLDRYTEAHYNVWLYATQASILEVLNSIPSLGMSTDLSRLSDPISTHNQYSIIRPLDLKDLIIFSDEPPHEVILPLVDVAEQQWEADNKPRALTNIKGLTVITKDRFKGNIMNHQADGFKWMDKQFKQAEISLKGKNNTNYGVLVKNLHFYIHPFLENTTVRFDIFVHADGSINQLEREETLQTIRKATEALLTKEITETYMHGLEIEVDLFRFSEIIYRRNFIIWKDIKKEGKIPLTKDSIRKINVNVNITDSRKQRKIPTLNK